MKIWLICICLFLYSGLYSQPDKDADLADVFYSTRPLGHDTLLLSKDISATTGDDMRHKSSYRFLQGGYLMYCSYTQEAVYDCCNGNEYVSTVIICDSTYRYKLRNTLLHIQAPGNAHYYYEVKRLSEMKLALIAVEPGRFYIKPN